MSHEEPLRIIPALAPETPEVQAGDVYEWAFDVETRAGRTMRKGDRLFVIQRTKDTPHREISFSGWNWLCRESRGDHVTIWATLEQCLQRRLLRKVQPEGE